GAQRKDDRQSVDLRFNAWPLTRGGQREGQAAAENRWVCLANRVGEHGVHYLGFHQKRDRVAPRANRGADLSTAIGKAIRVDLREWTRTCDAGDSHVLKLLALAGVKFQGTACGFPF